MVEKKIIHRSKSWKDLDQTLKKLIKNKKSKLAGSIFEYLTKLYLETSPEYKTKLKKVYLLNEVPIALKKKLKLPNTDEGIDLIAETFDKEYWAIQCKYRSDKSESLKVKGDLATFNNLAFTACKNISHGIVAATVNKPPQKKQLLNVGYILLTEWLSLDKNGREAFKQIKAKAVGKIIKPKKKKPKPHQKEAISKTISFFKLNERGKLIMPCGTGKSLTAFWIAQKMKLKSILIAVPSLALLQQTLKVWTQELLLNNVNPEWLCVCSDDTVKEDQDDFVTFSSDLGIKVDTNPGVIKKFLKKKTNKLKILFTTYQSGKATSIGSKGFTYDLGILDEAHKTVGLRSKLAAKLIHQKNIKIKNRLFMTATERLFKGSSDDYISMDNTKDYGELIYELTFKKAIESKPPIISDYKILTLKITNSEIEEITKSNKYIEIKKKITNITARELITAIALRKAIQQLKIKNALSFHRSITRADNFKKQQDLISQIYPEYGKLNTFHVTGEMPTSKRALEMMAFEEQQGLMTNARCLTEGVDLPAIDCVCFADPKRSKIDIVQAAGRALRKSPGKKFGYILIPVFVPEEQDFNEAAKEQGFEDVAVMTRALSTADKRIVEYLRSISEGKKPKGGSPVDGITSIKSLYKIDSEKFKKSVQLKIWDKVAIGNYRNVDEFIKIIKTYNFLKARDYYDFYSKKLLPKDFPYNPNVVYNKTWGELLSTGNISTSKRNFDFKASQKFYRNLVSLNNIKNQEDLYRYMRENNTQFPENVPRNVYNAFNDHPDYISQGIFMGYGKLTKGKFWNFIKARKFVRELGLKSSVEYIDWCDGNIEGLPPKPINIPRAPGGPYAGKGWKGWPDFIGFKNTGSNIKQKRFTFLEAKNFVKKLKFKSKGEFDDYCDGKRKDLTPKPDLLVKTCDQYYTKKDGWKGWQDFLGYKKRKYRPKKKFISIPNLKKLLNNKKIESEMQYRLFRKQTKRKDLPAAPQVNYGKIWKGWNFIFNKKKI